MLKGFVSGVEKDIVRIPMKGQNLLNLNRTYSNSFTTDTAKWMNGAATVNNAGTAYAETEILGDVVKVTSKNPGYGASFLIEASPNTTYTVSFETDKASSGSWGGISDRDINGTVISQTTIQGKSATFTTHDNCAFLNVCFRFPPADGTVTFSNIMLNLGSTALPYEPYGYQEGWEVRDNQDRLIWGREDELQTATGTLPFKGYGLPLKVKSLLGNAVQNGTPTPDNLVMPTFCGVRTANLFDTVNFENAYPELFDISGSIVRINTVAGRQVLYSDGLEFAVQAPFSISFNGESTNNAATNGRFRLQFDDDSYKEVQITKSDGSSDQYVSATFDKNLKRIKFNWSSFNEGIAFKNLMLNSGSIALPYEPFGWAEKITNAGQTVPIYLGEVPTVRWIRKLVLTGEESWDKGSYAFYRVITGIMAYKPVLCTHYQYYDGISSNAPTDSISTKSGVGMAIWIKTQNHADTTIEQWKSYLAAQYAAGTPVTVWYVLAEPETAIVNEPLAKIGDYADELNDTVATLPEIPTTTGQNTLTIDTTLAPSNLTIKGHVKQSS